MYDPTIGRWTTEDPIGFAGGDANLERYVGNDPTNATDPTGEQAFALTKTKADQMVQQLRSNGIDAYAIALGDVKLFANDFKYSLYLILSSPTKIQGEKYPLPMSIPVNNARGSFTNNKVFYNGPNGEDSIDLDPEKLSSAQRLDIFEANYAQYGAGATKGIGYEEFTKQEWTAAGMRIVVQQMLLTHPKNGPQLLEEAKKAHLSFGVDSEDLVARTYKLDSESRTILIKATGRGWGERSVGDAAERLYEALQEYTQPGFLSKLLNGAGVAFSAGVYDLNDPEDWKTFEEWDRNNRLGINDVTGRVRREVENQVGSRAAMPLVGAVLGRGLRTLQSSQLKKAATMVLGRVIKSQSEIREIVGPSLQTSGSHSNEWTGLWKFIRSGGGAGFQAVTKDPKNRLKVVYTNFKTASGNVVARIDLDKLNRTNVFDLQNPAVRAEFLRQYPRWANMYDTMAAEGVVAVRGDIPVDAVTGLVRVRGNASERSFLDTISKLME